MNRPFLRKLFLAVFLLSSALPVAFADSIETRAGKVHEGGILEEDSRYFYVDTASGVINVAKTEVMAVNGAPYNYMGQNTAPVTPGSKEAGKPQYMGHLSPEDRELSSLPKPGANVPVQFTSIGRSAAETGQAITSEADENAHAVIHSSGVTEKELMDYYAAHPDEFRMPVQLRLKFLNPLTMKGNPDDIARNPSSAGGWQDAGWKKKGDTFNAPFSADVYERIFRLRRGEALHVKDGAASYVFWVTDRKEPYVMPYEEARPRVLTRILNNKTR